MIKHYKLVKTIETLLSNRRLFVTFHGKSRRWRTSKNGLPQGSSLAPTLFNVYINERPISNEYNVRSFIYADDSAIAAQNDKFEKVQSKLSNCLNKLREYYRNNHLRTNPIKTEVSAFHLKNREAKRKLHVHGTVLNSNITKFQNSWA